MYSRITVTVHEIFTPVECSVTAIVSRLETETGPSVGERLQAAYEKVMAKRAKG